MTSHPDVEDYLHLFQMYGTDMSDIYLETDEKRYALLFEQVVRLLVRHSEFNSRLPEPFRVTARRYMEGHAETLAHMKAPENRNFMLSDLYDFVLLSHRHAS
ncbi:hypothetical protein JCM17960_03570 [Magnetospira thiophila]